MTPNDKFTVDGLGLDAARGVWEELAAVACRHDVFQSHAWARFERDVNGNEPWFLLVRKMGELVGGQLMLRRRVLGAFQGLEALGGPLHIEGCEEEVCAAVLAYLARHGRHVAYTTIRPQAPHELDGTLTGRGFAVSPLYTIVVDLARTEEEIWKALDGSARTGVKKGLKAGVEVGEGTTPEQWEGFGSVLSQHAREKGTIALTADALEYFHQELLPAGYCRLFVGKVDGQVVSGMLFLVWEEAMLFYYGASDSRWLDASPNDGVIWEALRWGCNHDVSHLDLYDTDPREDSALYGIHRFKAKWGGVLLERPFYVKGRPYLWVREQLRNNGLVRRAANVVRARGWA